MKDFVFESQAAIVKGWCDIKRLLWGEHDDHVFFSSDGNIGYYIPKKLCLVDFRAKAEPANVAFILGNDAGYKDAQIDCKKPVNQGKCKEVIMLKSTDTCVAVDSKFAKMLPADAHFMIKKATDPVRVYCHLPYDNEYVFAGIIMPIRLKGV